MILYFFNISNIINTIICIIDSSVETLLNRLKLSSLSLIIV